MYSSRLPTETLRIPAATFALPAILVLLSLLSYQATKQATFFMAERGETTGFAVVVFAALAALPFVAVRYAEVPMLLRAILRGIGAVVLAQVLFDSFGAVPPAPNIILGGSTPHDLFFRWGAVVGVTAGVLALWRPAFLVPLFTWYLAFRLLIGPRTGIWVSDTDFAAMTDGGTFAAVGALITITLTSDRVLDRLPWLRGLLADMPPAVLRQRAAGLVWAVVVGAHLGNYFCSGVAKLIAGGDAPWTWLMENPTQTAIAIGLERGDNPMATFPWLLQTTWDTIRDHALVVNVVVLGAQLLAPLAILRVRSLLFFTLLFDLFHLIVYLTLGALFHFWIAVNLIVYSSAWRLRDWEVTRGMKLACIAAAVFGHFAFYTNWLGWLDGAKLASPQFYAVTKDGREVWMPQVFYGIYSYTIAQAATYVPDNHFSFRIGGNNLNRQDWHDATHCGPRTEPSQNTGATLGAIERLVRETHAFMERHPAIKAYNLYYFYPHHMQPNPWLFTEFNRLALEDIVAYKYVVSSVCLTVAGGALQRDVRKREEFRYDVR